MKHPQTFTGLRFRVVPCTKTPLNVHEITIPGQVRDDVGILGMMWEEGCSIYLAISGKDAGWLMIDRSWIYAYNLSPLG